MTNFKTFKANPINGGIQYLKFFPNGYGVSIVQHDFSYGNEQGLWELAVLKGNENDWILCYDTPITDNVLGDLTEEEANSIVDKVSSL
jgi:hypothetical protein